MIYFDKNLEAYNFEISDYICSISDELWYKHNNDRSSWDIVDGKFIEVLPPEPVKPTDAEIIQQNKEIFNSNYFQFPEFIGKSGKVLCKSGYYKRKPKGFSSALESFIQVEYFISIYGGIKGNLAKSIIFYNEPDFLNYDEDNFEKFNPKEMDIEDAKNWLMQMRLLWVTGNYLTINE